MKTLRSIMRGALTGAIIITGAEACLSQGTSQGVFIFSNSGVNGGALAPVYGPESNDPSAQKWGNPTNGVPSGTQAYSGQPLSGTNYSVEAWYSTNAVSDVFKLLPDGSPVTNSLKGFGSSGSGLFGISYVTIANPLPVPGYPNFTNYPFYVFLQVRAWDNEGGQLPTWNDAWNAAVAGSGKAVGWSKVFWQPLQAPLVIDQSPGMPYFESFNSFIVPEPSPAVLLLVGSAFIGFLSKCRSRSQRHSKL